MKSAVTYINEWLSTQKQQWLVALVNRILQKRADLDQNDLKIIYEIFLSESELVEQNAKDDKESSAKIVFESDTKAPSDSEDLILDRLGLLSLKEVSGVNALAQEQEIVFHPKLTIIFGYNGAGKSSYIRILKNACNSRSVEKILPNVLANGNVNCYAKIYIELNGKQHEINWNNEQGIWPLTEVKIFDNKCVPIHLTAQLNFNFEPFGLELFRFISNSMRALREQLQSDIDSRKQPNTFLLSLTFGTSTYDLVAGLSPAIKYEQIEKAARWGDDLQSRLDAKIKEKASLEAYNLEDRIKSLAADREKVDSIKLLLYRLNLELSQESIDQCNYLLQELSKSQKIAKQCQLSLAAHQISKQDSPEWLSFIKSAEIYIKHLDSHQSYPTDGDKCIYCQQPLSKEARDLIDSYRKLVSSAELKKLEQLEAALEIKINNLKTLMQAVTLLIESDESQEVRILEMHDKHLYQSLQSILNKAHEQLENLVNNLQLHPSKLPKIKSLPANKIIAKLENIVADINGTIDKIRLDHTSKNKLVTELDRDIKELIDRKKLAEGKDGVVSYLENIKWIQKATEALNRFSTTSITNLSKKAWEELVSDSFRENFELERKALRVRPIEFAFTGTYGVQKRAKSIAGYTNIDDILSEGEQKAISLADFLAELSTQAIKTPVIFDDPVTSFDHQRIKVVADRVIKESERRQVIILTHNVMLLSYIYQKTRKEKNSAAFHMIEANTSGAGIVTLNDHPFAEGVGVRMDKVNKIITAASSKTGSEQQELIARGYDNLRPGCENLLVEEVFGKVIQRFEPDVKMMRISQIKYNPSLVEEIKDLWEKCSRFINAHSHADAQIDEQPTLEDLKEDLKRLSDIYVKIKSLNKAIKA